MAERGGTASVGRSESVEVGKTSGKQEASFNIVQITSEVVEDHLTLVRNLSTALAAAGVVVLARSIRLTAKFGSASEIPAWFVEKNVRLRGRVRRVTETSLQVEHVPIQVPLLSPLLGKRRPPHTCLPLDLPSLGKS